MIVVMVKVTCAVIDRPQGDGVEGATRFEHMIVPFYLSRASKITLNQTLIEGGIYIYIYMNMMHNMIIHERDI